VFPLKSREEVAALPAVARLRYCARWMWLSIAGSIVFGLQIAFLEGFRTVGLLLAGMGLLIIPLPIWFTLRARRLRRQST
jgi:hypothetical protein